MILGPVPPVGIARTFSYGQHPPAWKATIVIGGTIPGARFSAQGCYSQHNSACGRPRRPHGLGLLFAAHFKAGCDRGRISGILHAGLLFSAHFLVLGLLVFIAIPCFFKCISVVVIVCTFLRVTAAFPSYPPQQTKKKQGCYPQHNFIYSLHRVFHAFLKLGSAISPGKSNCPAKSTPPPTQKNFRSHPLLFSAHFQNPKKSFSFFLQPHPAAKIFFLRIVLSITTVFPCCYPRHNSKSPACAPQNFSPPLGGCYPAHILWQSPHFVSKRGCYPPHIVVPGTDLWLVPAQCACYSAHISVVIGGTALPYI